jgi:hypothetical protein
MALNINPKVAAGLAIGAGIAKRLLGKKNSEKVAPGKGQVVFSGALPDRRVLLEVPMSYINGSGPTWIFESRKGLLFPYTPTIAYDSSASYSEMNLMQSNYSIYSYKSSKIGAISLTARFTVQNDFDAQYYLAAVHLLRALIKMRTGIEDSAGSPPPVCKLQAYGPGLIQNVPVVVSSFRTDLPNDVDYYSWGSSKGVNGAGNNGGGGTMVPTISSITITLLPMYSRLEQLGFNIPDWLDGTYKGDDFSDGIPGRGYL